MLLPRFDFHRPTSVAEICELLDEYGDSASLVAGGTDVLVNLKRKLIAPSHVVGIDLVSDLDGIRTVNGEVLLGSMVTAADLAENRTVRRQFPVLAQAAEGLGSPPIRNRATIGGNLVTARPAADLIPPLMVLDARVNLVSQDGARVVPVARFVTGPGKTVIKTNEVLTRVVIPRPDPATGGAYIKFGARHSCEISIVSVAAFVSLTPAGRRIKSAKLVLGAVAPKPIRCPRAEELLAGATPGEIAFAGAGRAAARAAKPITDHRGSARYRRQMVDVLTRRALVFACEAAREGIAGRVR
ncbi:MAG: xanthine dehydrogenase family protein subunit M [Lentisphaerae bacterium]|nr:xanthine dehydrogenase family protein subunit M [Lentisphaerota bacterium]